MSRRAVCGGLLLIAIAAGTLSDQAPNRKAVELGGYRVLAADFHVHTFPFSASTLAPWDAVVEARRQSLDAIAITPHNATLAGKVGQWFARRIGGPTVLVGEEIHAPGYHLIAVGIHSSISWRLNAAAAIDQVHKQGGIAIAAHPVAQFWPAFDTEAMRTLDGAEVLQPIAYSSQAAAGQLRQFYERRRLTAIGSSDYHGLGPLGLCRTYVFAREQTENGILDALRTGRTVVFDRDRAYGDPALVRLSVENRRLLEARPPSSVEAFLVVLSRICALVGLIGLMLFGFRS
jgi:PHP domain-containing protein